MTIETMLAQRLERALARYRSALAMAQKCQHADDIVTLAARAKCAYTVVQELEDFRFEVLGER